MRRQAFTLVELLAVIAIIAIVMSFSVGAVWLAQEYAREARTASQVQKIHNIIIDRWETYRTRRVSLQVPPSPASRLQGIRELMRLEMPDRYEDIIFAPSALTVDATTGIANGIQATYLRRIDAARAKYNAANGTTWGNSLPRPDLRATAFIDSVLADDGTGRNPNECAECLYLIVMASFPADERSDFRDRDFADTNGNFMPEFIDAWGTPIRWLRWAPGVNSDVQTHEPVNQHDPFDPFTLQIGLTSEGIDKGYPPAALAGGEGKPPEWGYIMLPFIYSAGADRTFGIHQALTATPATVPLSLAKNAFPYARHDDGNGGYVWRGEPDVSAGTYHHDNIHSHQPPGRK